jgi:hypothetical protein
MFHGTYSDARQQAKTEGKWLLVNLQDETVFASHMLNRDTWSDDVVQNVVASGFVFWQVRVAMKINHQCYHMTDISIELYCFGSWKTIFSFVPTGSRFFTNCSDYRPPNWTKTGSMDRCA